MPISTDFLSGLYNRHSCYADRLSVEQLDAIHVPTAMEDSLRRWIKAKKDLVITGNPGDGKTFLLRRLAKEIAKVQGIQILDATAEKDYESIVRTWSQARKAARPFFLAINHGPLNRLLHEHSEGNTTLQEVRRQLDHSVYYGEIAPKPPTGVVVIDLNLRSVLTPAIIAGSLDNILREDHYESSPYFTDATTDGSGNRLFEKFLALYRHARARLKIVLVDPPEASSLLDQVANKVVRRELDVQSLHVSVYRTLERPLVLGGNDQQLEAIAEVFSDDDDRAFMLEVHPDKTTYGDIVRKLSKDPVHLMVVFDPSTTQVGQFFQSNRGIVHPLVLPKEFKYDAMEDELFITPAASGGVFDLFQSLQGRLNNALSGSQFGLSSLLTGQFADTTDLLKHCTWLVIADRLLDSQPIKGGHMISYEQGPRRDIVVLTESLTKFEREFDYQLRQTNFDPTPEAVRELIVSSGELIGEGLLGLISSSERDDNVF